MTPAARRPDRPLGARRAPTPAGRARVVLEWTLRTPGHPPLKDPSTFDGAPSAGPWPSRAGPVSGEPSPRLPPLPARPAPSSAGCWDPLQRRRRPPEAEASRGRASAWAKGSVCGRRAGCSVLRRTNRVFGSSAASTPATPSPVAGRFGPPARTPQWTQSLSTRRRRYHKGSTFPPLPSARLTPSPAPPPPPSPASAPAPPARPQRGLKVLKGGVRAGRGGPGRADGRAASAGAAAGLGPRPQSRWPGLGRGPRRNLLGRACILISPARRLR